MSRRPRASLPHVLGPVITIALAILSQSSKWPTPVVLTLGVIAFGVCGWLFAEPYLRRIPIVADLQGGSIEQEEQMLGGGMRSTRRIRVFNRGRDAVENIHVRIENSAPQTAPFYPVYLQRMHSLPQPFKLGAGQYEFLDIVIFNSTDTLQQLWLAHDRQKHPNTPNGFAIPRLELFVSIQTDDGKASHKFVAYRDKSGKVQLDQLK